MTSVQILLKYWGYAGFRPLQEQIIDSVLAGKDTLALMPTGGGKSICFQVPALMLSGVCIVVTPLIALMKDQVQQLQNRGIRALAIFSGMHYREIDITLDNCVNGEVKFLYVSPERLETELFQERLKRMKVSLLAVDEAHCISQWGYDFRPPYLRIADIRELIPNVPVLAVTATATPAVVLDIQKRLNFKQENLFEMSFERSNLKYHVEQKEDKMGRLLQLLQQNPGTAIVYVRNRRKTKEIAIFLMQNDIPAHYYHAGLTTDERDAKQSDWIQNRVRVIVSTNAFGMGIDKPDVRLVVHLDVPDSLEAYFQEAGRAGRDGKMALAVLIYHKSDLMDLQRNFEMSFPEIAFIKNVYNALGNYFQLAVGSGVDESNEFVIADFVQMYNLNANEAYSAIRFLEKEGYLFLSDAINRPSKLIITVDRETLYRHQVRYPQMGDFIDVLIRSYSGLFTDFAIIDENVLARRLNTSALVVENMLKLLHKTNVITYIPKTSKPQIIFNGGRLNNKEVVIYSEHYQLLKETAEKRLKSVVYYVTSSTKCRSELLLSYFGQSNIRRCGQCDVCLLRNTVALSQHEFDLVVDQIKPLLQQQNLSIYELLTKLPNLQEDRLIKVLRWLMDNGKVADFGEQLIWVK